MSAFSAAASDEDGDTIKQLRAAIEQARNWIAEHPDRRPISAGRMVAILTNALAAAPQPPAVKDSLTTRPQVEQEPVAWLFQHEETGLTELVDVQQVEWGFEKNNPRWQKIGPVYTHPQPKREPLTDEQIACIEDGFSNEFGLEAKHSIDFARAIERAHGIGGEE